MLAFAALADPTRRQIVELLTQRELPAGEIALRFAVSPPAISQHLKVLREAGLVSVRADAQRRIYGIHAAGFSELEQWLAHVKTFWQPKLEELERQILLNRQSGDRESGKRVRKNPRKSKGNKQ